MLNTLLARPKHDLCACSEYHTKCIRSIKSELGFTFSIWLFPFVFCMGTIHVCRSVWAQSGTPLFVVFLFLFRVFVLNTVVGIVLAIGRNRNFNASITSNYVSAVGCALFDGVRLHTFCCVIKLSCVCPDKFKLFSNNSHTLRS